MKYNLASLKTYVARYRFLVFILTSITVALTLVVASMILYYNSDAFRLDLSRPEYESRRSEISNDTKETDEFDAQGDINAKTIDQFLKLYDAESKKVLDTPAFGSDVLSDTQLGIDGN